MSVHQFTPYSPNVFVYDLEFLGNVEEPSRTQIWNIGCVHRASGRVFSCIVEPGVSDSRLRRFHTWQGCQQVTREWLDSKNPLRFGDAFSAFVKFVDGLCSGVDENGDPMPPVMVAHGNFKADKPVLEGACRRSRCDTPNHWLFFDSLYWFRSRYPGLPSYSLTNLGGFFGIYPHSQHLALPDCLTLCTLMGGETITGVVYSWGSVPLITVPGLGSSTEKKLISKSICSVQSLVQFALKFKQCSDKEVREAMLRQSMVDFDLGRPGEQVAAFCEQAICEENVEH